MKEEQQWAHAMPTLYLIFSIFSAMFWALMTGFVKPEAALLCSVIQIAVYPSYLVGATILLKNKDGFSGNVFFYFCAFFSSVSGATGIVTYFANLYGWPIDASIMGIVWLWIGIMLGFSLPGSKGEPWIFFVISLLTVVGLLSMGLTTLGILPASITKPTGWLFGVISLMGLYVAVAQHVEFAGLKFPLGKSLFK